MKFTINDREYTGVDPNNMGYDVTMLMTGWTDDNWLWWAYQIKRFGLQGRIQPALDQWDDDNSTGVVGRT